MFFYRVFTWLYPKLAWFLGFSNRKARLWVTGRRDLFTKLSAAFYKNTAPVIWMHCASVGEFEQGLPVLEKIRVQYPSHCILLTFFSPSGYEVRKDYPGVDHVYYLPMDSSKNANRFLNIVQPSLILFVKYEFWYFYLQEASQRRIPLLLISGIFRKDQPFFRWYGSMHRRMLRYFSKLLVQDPSSAMLLERIGLQDTVLISGDTRFDRVMEIAGKFSDIPLIAGFCADHTCLVAGSTWTEDDEALDHFVNSRPAMRCLVAPHIIEEERLRECEKLYHDSMRFSAYAKAVETNSPIPEKIHTLIIDNVGMLSRLYKYATLCYVGGGFGDDGIHNILEAAVYGKPVVFGPVFDKYLEAVELLDAGGAFSIEDALELESVLHNLLTDTDTYQRSAAASEAYVRHKAGATEKVMTYIQENRLLTS